MPMPAEHELIRRYFAPLAGPGGLKLADDAGLLPSTDGWDWVVNTDTVGEGVHFFADDPPESIAAKALRVNLSDLAAKGAEAHAYLLALAIGRGVDEAWIASFARGLASDQDRYRVHLLGGDTTRSMDSTVVTVTAFGRVPSGRFVPRAGARPGDVVVISGTIGDAALGLQVRKGLLAPASEADRAFLVDRFRCPEPRTELAALLRDHAHAAMDVSDGLIGDLAKLCAASAVAAELQADRVPLSPATRAICEADSMWQEMALTGGDDYEILAAIDPVELPEMLEAANGLGVSLTPVGSIREGEGVTVRTGDGRVLDVARPSYEHLEPTP